MILGIVVLSPHTSLIWAQKAMMLPPAPSREQVVTPVENQGTPLLSVDPSNGSLGEFAPTRDTILDSAYPFWNGKPVDLSEPDSSGKKGAVFNLTHVYVPAGVKVQIKNYTICVFNAIGNIIINGSLEATGSNLLFVTKGGGITMGASGSASANGSPGGDGGHGLSGTIGAPPLPGGRGGNGGSGGARQDGRRINGAGYSGCGGGGVIQGACGDPGDGPLDTAGSPIFVEGSYQARPAGGCRWRHKWHQRGVRPRILCQWLLRSASRLRFR